MSQRASTGGAAGASGVGFEGRIGAWAAAHALTGRPLPNGWGTAAAVTAIGAQTGLGVDDFGLTRDDGGFVLGQGKKRLGLGPSPDSPLAEALRQVVHTVLNGIVADDGTGRPARPVNGEHDILAIVTDPSAPAKVKEALVAVVDRLAHLPGTLPIDGAGTNEDETQAAAVLLGHIRREWENIAGAAPADPQIRGLLKVLRVRVLDLDDGKPDRTHAELLLRPLLADPATAGGTFDALATLSLRLAENQQWHDVASIRTHLRRTGTALASEPRLTADIALLKKASAQYLALDLDAGEIRTPAGPLRLARDVAPALASADGNLAVVGDPGAGKTSVAAQTARAWSDAGRDVVYLPAATLIGSAADVRAELDLEHALSRVLDGWEGTEPAALIIDGLDASRLAEPSGWLRALIAGLADSRWRIIATIRVFDLRHRPSWQNQFPGRPPIADRALADLPRVRHLLVGELSDAELAPAFEAHPALAQLSAAAPSVKALVRNPFNLALAADLLADGDPDDTAAVAGTTTQLELLLAFWHRRVNIGPNPWLRIKVLKKIIERMLVQRRLRLTTVHDLLDATEMQALTELIADGVLREEPGPTATTPIMFAHAVLFDFAVTTLIFDRDHGSALPEHLDAQPDLVVLARPSIDFHLDTLWRAETSRRLFWTVVLTLAAPGAHPLAATAAAAVVLAQPLTTTDLEPLAQACAGEASSERDTARTFLSNHLAAAVAAANPTGTTRLEAVTALAQLADRLAQAAASSGDARLGLIVTAVLRAINTAVPVGNDGSASTYRASAAAAVIRAALAEPDDNLHRALAGRAADLLVDTVLTDPEAHGPLLDRLCEPQFMEAWGVSVIARPLHRLADIAAVRPDTAVRMAQAVWEYVEPEPDQITTFNDSKITSFSGTRGGDAEAVRYEVGVHFPQMLDDAPAVAVQIYLAVMETRRPAADQGDTAAQMLDLYLDPEGMLEVAGGHGRLKDMTGYLTRHLDALAQTPGTTPDDPATDIIAQLIEQLRHSGAWAKILNDAALAPTTLAPRLAPALLSPTLGLMAHPITLAPAARLITAAAPHLDAATHGALEQQIWALTDPDAPAAPFPPVSDMVDLLLGTLDRKVLTDQRSIDRLAALDADGGPPPPGPRSVVFDYLLNDQPAPATPRSPLTQATATLQCALPNPNSEPPQIPPHLGADLRQLHQLQTRADDNDPDLGSAAEAAARAAKMIVGAPEEPADHDLIDLAAAALLHTATTRAPIPPTARAHAAEGLLTLIGWPGATATEHAGPAREALTELLDHPDPYVRAAAAPSIRTLHPDAAARRDVLIERLDAETDDGVVVAVLNQTVALSLDEPAAAAEVLESLAVNVLWGPVFVGDETALEFGASAKARFEMIADILIYLSTVRGQESARARLHAWLGDPLSNPWRAGRICTRLRDYLNPSGDPTTVDRAQCSAFALMATALPPALRIWNQVVADAHTGTMEVDARKRAALKVPASISEQLYFASGAYQPSGQPAELPTAKGPGSHRRFAERAFPLLEQLAGFGAPALTNDLVKTLTHLADTDPGRAARTAAASVDHSIGYEYEWQGEDAVLSFVDRYTGELRDYLVNDPSVTTALRSILDRFVAAGWERIITRAQSMSEIFR